MEYFTYQVCLNKHSHQFYQVLACDMGVPLEYLLSDVLRTMTDIYDRESIIAEQKESGLINRLSDEAFIKLDDRELWDE